MSDLISVIVLNWNGGTFVEKCMETIMDQDYGNLEIIVVDNASDDDSAGTIEKRFPNVSLIRNQRNLGFGGGNNIGIRLAGGDYLVIMNNDVELHPSCISEMKAAMDKDRSCGACASRIYLKYEKDLLDAAGIAIYPDGISIGRGRLEPGDRYGSDEEVFFASGCCALYRKAMFEDIRVAGEYYDEDFFAYADDTDLGWRARMRGWTCVYNPRAIAYHLHSASAGTYSPAKAFLVERNRISLQVKCFPLAMILYGLPFTFLRYAYQAYGAFKGKGASGEFVKEHSRLELVGVLFKVFGAAIREFPKMVGKRREIQKRRLISVGEMFRLLRLYGMSPKDMAFRR